MKAIEIGSDSILDYFWGKFLNQVRPNEVNLLRFFLHGWNYLGWVTTEGRDITVWPC
jgi:hypothetical protein